MSEFDEIRPYNDDEVEKVLESLVNDREFTHSIIRLRVNRWLFAFSFIFQGIVTRRLQKVIRRISTVADFQAEIEPYLVKSLDETTTDISVSGLDTLDKDSAYLFVSNHRDIAMDPALVNLMIYRAGFSTLRIAIGDNLLTKPFVSDLMRLNKSFIVNRSATAPREKLKAAKLLSKYIHHSVMQDNENVWIAQREGRAKDGLDRTNAAIISMISLSKPKPQALSEFIREARIVPVSISYEYDPCDVDKAREIVLRSQNGEYQKEEHEDVRSIAKGITGFKGKVHLSFGQPLSGDFQKSEDVTKELDKKIIQNYCLQLSNCFAFELIEGRSPLVKVGPQQQSFMDIECDKEREQFKQRLNAVDEAYRKTFLEAYANPVRDKLARVQADA